jgi:cobalt-zinc-cadmium efflux system outer membrane protein
VTEARGDYESSRTNQVAARLSSFLNPYVEVQGQSGAYTKDVSINGFVALPWEVSGQRSARMAEADRLEGWKKANVQRAEWAVLGDVVEAYGNALVDAARIREALRAEEDARRELDHNEQRLKVGDVTVFEVSLSEAEVARWAQVRAEYQIRFLQSRSALAQAMGVLEVDEPKDMTDKDLMPIRKSGEVPPVENIVASSPIVRTLGLEAAYWVASGERAKAEKYPATSLIVNGGRGDMGEWRAGAGLAWTLPTTRRNQGEMAKANAEASRARQVMDRWRVTLTAKAAETLEVFRISRQAIEEQERTSIPAAQRVVDAAFSSYRAGKGELLRVFLARRELSTARTRLLDLIQTHWRAYATLAALTGELP